MMPEGEDVPGKVGPLANGLLQIACDSSNAELKVCSGCSEIVVDRFYLNVADRYWHEACLRCSMCQARLGGDEKCYERDGLTFCREDYYVQFQPRCSRCLGFLDSNCLVMRARKFTYHHACFTCDVCHIPLVPGTLHGLNAATAQLYCQAHCEPLLNSDTPEPLGDDTYSVPRRKKKRSGGASDDGYRLGMDCDEFSPVSSGGQRSKRMRTSFKHHQLSAMKKYFALNHNPDAKDLKQLAQRTGLTKRVLQVWFQNARAKYRRSLQQDSSSNPDHVGSSSETQLKSEHPKNASDTNDDSEGTQDEPTNRMLGMPEQGIFPLETDILIPEQQQEQGPSLFFFDSVA